MENTSMMPNTPTWDDPVRLLMEIGQGWSSEHGDQPIPRQAILDDVERLSDYGRDSILPSDYCYNRVNRGRMSGRNPLFIREDRGLYRYVGRDYPYTGPICWQPKQREPRQVGVSLDGRQCLYEDPRD